jgi:hypothetical protein
MMRTFLQNKPIFILLFLCVFTSINMQAMELVLYNPDLLQHLTLHLCNTQEDLTNFPHNVKTFSRTNKYLYNYYEQEKVQQNIIDYWTRRQNPATATVIHFLNFHTIKKNFEYYFDISRNKEKNFTQDDLKKLWYFNTYDEEGKTLLYNAVNNLDLEKAQLIIKLIPDFTSYIDYNNRLFLTIIYLHSKSENNPELSNTLLSIAQSLLDKKIPPYPKKEPAFVATPLSSAVLQKNKKMVHLLIEYNANPDFLITDFIGQESNAFSNEPEPGWLQKIIDEVAQEQQEKL